MNNKIPTEITITTASILDAVMYWLKQEVFKENVEVSEIVFNKQTENFTVKFNKSEKEI